MTSNPPSITKFALFKAPKTTKPPQEPYVAYYATQGSAREQSRTVTRGVDCLTINSISPSRPLTLDTQPSMRKIQNFRISSLASQAPSPSNSQLDEKNMRRLQTRGSIGVSDSQNVISNRAIPSSIGFRTKLEKKESDNDIKKEEVWRPLTRQQQPNQKENSIKQTSEKRIIIKTLPSHRENLSDDEKKKISMYFRYKIFSISKIIEDKARGTLQALIKNENVLMDDIWKTLKTLASLKRKYKCRDVVNYNRKLRETMKELFPLVSPKLEKRSATISLDDESPNKGPTKKPKSPDNNRASSLGEFIMRRKEAPATKVFIIIGGYPDLKRALEERGWIENPDPASKDFNLKWCSKLDIKYDTLKPNQYVNHFDKNTALTTKVGLTRSMRNLVWFDNEDIDQFFPRCYDLNDAPEFDDFLQDFKFEQAIATLRLAKNKTKGMNIQDYNLYKLRLCLALNICERRLRPFETLLYDMMKNEVSIFTQEEWELMNIQDLDSNIMNDAKYTKILTSLKRRYGFEPKQTIVPENEESLFIQAQANLARLEKYFPQVALNQGKNIWIVKPAGLSRGRGICCHNSLPNILDHIQIKESEWVVQKYIENPLIIKKRKFDIRQWVLVTDWSPLTVWFYDECYIRFTAQDFNPEDLTNKFAHLTNNAIGKNASNFETSEIEGNMWDSKEFEAYLKKLTGRNIFETVIKLQMKHIIVKSLLSGQDMLDARKNSFELYGYDFMVDDNYKVWVLEINSSPSMDYSTSITERLVRSVMTDCVKVIVDHGMAKGESKRNADTGNFECIYAGKALQAL